MARGGGLIRGARSPRRAASPRRSAAHRRAVRAAVRAAHAPRPALPPPPASWSPRPWSGGGHDPGSGPLPADLPIEIDLWPRDEASTCWADMTRTFVNGEISDEVADRLRDIVRDALEQVRAAARARCRQAANLYDIAAEVVERAGFPTQRTREALGQTLTRGLLLRPGPRGRPGSPTSKPGLGLAGRSSSPGDVIAIEPGIEGLDGIGGVAWRTCC